jgi:hypothetical protein
LDLKAAGIDKLKAFEHFPVMDNLAGGDPLKYDAVCKMNIDVGHTKLLLEQVRDGISKEYQNIKTRKSKP